MLKIENYVFCLTCIACPEQYDVFDKDNELIAYVRYRHGRLTVNPYILGTDDIDLETLIYSEEIGDEYDGCFSDEEERLVILNKAAEKIKDFYNKKTSSKE